jgi:cell division protein FtsW
MKKRNIDIILMVAVLALTFLGLLMISSSSYVMASEAYGDRYYYIKRHLVYLVLAAFAYLTTYSLKTSTLRKIAIPAFIISILLLILTLVSPLGSFAGGANRWIRLAGFRFQPSEFARLTTIIFLAHLLCKTADDIRDLKRGLLLPLAIVGGVALLILSEPDFGTAMSVGMTGMILIYVAGARFKYLALAMVAAIPLAAYAMVGSTYRRARLLTYLDPFKDPLGSGFQIIQSFIAIRAGGFFGQGLGDGVQKIYFLPEAHTDFAFAILGEELGFIGVCGVILLYLIIVARGALIAARCRDRFHAITATGITFAFGIQAFTNMAVVMGLLPTKGLTLPLISFGGSSLIATFAAIGLLQGIVKQERRGTT